jgi:NAD(P)-dependent dehydrogenase (short-subunit alcohol dehydrogenase family)
MKRILITGGSGGIGYALCQIFNQNGYQVYTIDKKKPKDLDKSISFKMLDLRDYRAVAKYANSLDSIDILINNAAIQIEEPFINSSIDSIQDVIETNIIGTLALTNKIIPKMSKNGLIINIGSIHGTIPRINKMTYDMSKAALEMMTKELALELAPNIRVNQLNIGATHTPMNQVFDKDQKKLEDAKNKVPMKHIFTPEEIAKVVYQLTNDVYQYMTGSIIVYDGGRSLV